MHIKRWLLLAVNQSSSINCLTVAVFRRVLKMWNSSVLWNLLFPCEYNVTRALSGFITFGLMLTSIGPVWTRLVSCLGFSHRWNLIKHTLYCKRERHGVKGKHQRKNKEVIVHFGPTTLSIVVILIVWVKKSIICCSIFLLHFRCSYLGLCTSLHSAEYVPHSWRLSLSNMFMFTTFQCLYEIQGNFQGLYCLYCL